MLKDRNNEEVATVQSVGRALKILEVLSKQCAPLSVSDIAHRVDLKLSTVYRLLSTLVHYDFVTQEDETSKYRLTLKLLHMGKTALDFYDLRTTARPFMKELLNRCNETTNLAVLEEGDVVYIDQLESTNLILVRMFAKVGSRGPAHCTATGKTLLAGLPEDELDKILNSISLDHFTNATITERQILRKELAKVRSSGYALDLGERENEVKCIAAPVRNHEGKVIGAIGVSGPATRITNYYLKTELKQLVCDVAEKFSKEMGHSGNSLTTP
ncbi:MAG: IclR family transcriptional regulator [Firmicutes bacterium]|nr:IclR family transcriptional regulator [Bacillota bacterium]